MRYTKSEVKGMFSRLCKALGKREDADSYNGLVLDYSACYGGYVIEEVEPVYGSCSHPFGAMRRNAREMYLSMHMVAVALENINFNKNRGG